MRSTAPRRSSRTSPRPSRSRTSSSTSTGRTACGGRAAGSASPPHRRPSPEAMSVLDRLRDVPGRGDARLPPLRGTVAFRAWQRYGAVRGNVLAGGVAYFAFFSIFPALAIGFTLFPLVLGSQENLQAQLVQYINSS